MSEKQLEERRQAAPAKLTSALILHDEETKKKKDKVDAYKEGKIDLIIVLLHAPDGVLMPLVSKRLYLGRRSRPHNLCKL